MSAPCLVVLALIGPAACSLVGSHAHRPRDGPRILHRPAAAATVGASNLLPLIACHDGLASTATSAVAGSLDGGRLIRRRHRASIACRIDKEEGHAYLASLTQLEGVHALPRSLCGKLPLLCGPVANGFGRGSRKLGIPTANLPCSMFQQQLAEVPRGVYVGWAAVQGQAHKCVCNIGVSPTFVGQENPEKIVEAHLMSEFSSDFYGERMALVLLGFVREERKFGGLDELLATIRSDIATAEAALDVSPLCEVASSPLLLDALLEDQSASYELVEPARIWPTPTKAVVSTEAEVSMGIAGNPIPAEGTNPEQPPPRGFEWGPLL